jgi:hypothetical protein
MGSIEIRSHKSNMTSSIIIGIPGIWDSQREISAAIARSYRFVYAGKILLDMQTQKSCYLEVYDRDPHLTTAFDIAGKGFIPDTILHDISTHTHTVYAIANSPSMETAAWMLKVGECLLAAGGLAVKIESAGLAHTKETWRSFATDGSLTSIYPAFVTLLRGEHYYYSCGMQNFGLPDVSLDDRVEARVAAAILNEFNYYQLVDRPHLADGHTFSIAADAPRFAMALRPCEGYDPSMPL